MDEGQPLDWEGRYIYGWNEGLLVGMKFGLEKCNSLQI